MTIKEKKLLISDSSTLINFLRIRRTDLLLKLPFKLLITDVVRLEITNRYQLDELEIEINKRNFEVVSLQEMEDLKAVADFKRMGLGDGESVSIVAANKLGTSLAIDDLTAVKRAKEVHPDLDFLSTQEIILMNIRQGNLDILEADSIKESWKKDHRFTLKIQSFRDLIGKE